MASILADRQYTLSDYKNYEKLNITQELEQDVIEKINRLAKRVGAPSYQKTPVFKRKIIIKGLLKKKIYPLVIGKLLEILKQQNLKKIQKVLKLKWIKLGLHSINLQIKHTILC